jgi:opacity protein-like surface antigen
MRFFNGPTNQPMKRIPAIALFAASLAVSAPAVIVGASVGYLTDSQDTYCAARAGIAFNSTNSLAHIGEFEIGYTSDSESGAEASLLPLTLNYRAQFTGTGQIGGYAGFGAGLARTRVSVPGSGVPTISDSGTSFAAQGFAGVSFRLSPTASLDLGARYLWIDDVKLQAWGVKAEVGDDLAIEAGLHLRF